MSEIIRRYVNTKVGVHYELERLHNGGYNIWFIKGQVREKVASTLIESSAIRWFEQFLIDSGVGCEHVVDKRDGSTRFIERGNEWSPPAKHSPSTDSELAGSW